MIVKGDKQSRERLYDCGSFASSPEGGLVVLPEMSLQFLCIEQVVVAIKADSRE